MLNWNLNKSVYFFTLHKCASSLFAQKILPFVEGLKHVDYAKEIFSGNLIPSKKTISFASIGFIYGPIRLSAPKNLFLYSDFVVPAIENCIRKKGKPLFMIRDPRDILISQYYSFGFSHGISSEPSIQSSQLEIRKQIATMSLDEYCLLNAEKTAENFWELKQLANKYPADSLFKYEHLIENPEVFIAQLKQFVPLKQKKIEEIKMLSRPRECEDIFSHKRSGKIRAYAEKLKPQTISKINQKLEKILKEFEYEK